MRPIQALLRGGPQDGDLMVVEHDSVTIVEMQPLSLLHALAENPGMMSRTGHYRSTPVIVYEWVGWDGE